MPPVELVTTDEAKEWIGLSGTGTDAFLAAASVGVSDAVLRYVDMVDPLTGAPIPFDSTTQHTAILDGPGTDRIALPHLNVKQVDELYEDLERGFGASTLVPATDYHLIQRRGTVVRDGYTVFVAWSQSVKCLYKLNYPDGTPEAVKMWTLRQIGYEWNVRKNQGVASKTLPDGSIVYLEPVALLKAVKDGLEECGIRQSMRTFA